MNEVTNAGREKEVQVKERPILFSAPMVRAILAGTKTQTRRVVKTGRFPQSEWTILPSPDGQSAIRSSRDGIVFNTDCGMPAKSMQDKSILCPYGVPGDRLWVREAWCLAARKKFDQYRDREQVWPSTMRRPHVKSRWNGAHNAIYRADGEHIASNGVKEIWTPSIFMPRWASRLLLEITDVRVQRVRDISESDAKAEGCDYSNEGWRGEYGPGFSRVAAYRDLWNDINGKKYPWNSNPWVWCLTFKVVK